MSASVVLSAVAASTLDHSYSDSFSVLLAAFKNKNVIFFMCHVDDSWYRSKKLLPASKARGENMNDD